MTTLKRMAHALTLSYFLIMSVNPVLGISVSYGTDGASSSRGVKIESANTTKLIVQSKAQACSVQLHRPLLPVKLLFSARM
jgi:hypothetical protein